MKQIFLILRFLWKIYFLIEFVILLLIFYPFYFVFFTANGLYNFAYTLQRIHSKLAIFFAGIFYKVKKTDNFKFKGPYIITPNHSSYLDIILLYCIMPVKIVFLAKKELGKVPLFNVFFKKYNILVDRQSIIDAHRSWYKIAYELDNGNSVVIFPEGTIPDNAPNMKKFKNGAFKLAFEKNVPILPVLFKNNYKLLQEGKLFSGYAGPGISHSVIFKPLYPKDFKNPDEMKDYVFNLMNSELKNAQVKY